jgi:hypothetical protein
MWRDVSRVLIEGVEGIVKAMVLAMSEKRQIPVNFIVASFDYVLCILYYCTIAD